MPCDGRQSADRLRRLARLECYQRLPGRHVAWPVGVPSRAGLRQSSSRDPVCRSLHGLFDALDRRRCDRLTDRLQNDRSEDAMR
jgi:hypothetical protein